MQKLIPKLLDHVIKFTRWGIDNPYNGMDYLVIGFYDAVFIKEFGPWSEGHKPHTLVYDPMFGTLTESDQIGYILNTCETIIQPK